jgi:hypothetical protein
MGPNLLYRGPVTPAILQRILENPRSEVVKEEPGEDAKENVTQPLQADDAGKCATDNSNKGAKFYARNDKYDFSREGHVNRSKAMGHLEPTAQFQAWKQAAQQDWACIHAKFYVSHAEQMKHHHWVRPSNVTELLPSMKPVVDVKATEKAVYATDFLSLGAAAARRSSGVRMRRLSLNDQPGCASGPIFEVKLYYRPEVVEEEDADASFEVSIDEDVDEENSPPVEKLSKETPLVDYKFEKSRQVNLWHRDNKAPDPVVADSVLHGTLQGINDAQDLLEVDGAVKIYSDWYLRHELQVKD